MNKYTHLFSIIRYFFKPYKARLLILLLFMLTGGLLEMLNIAALYPVINYGLNAKESGIMADIFSWLMDIATFFPNQFFASCVMLMFITLLAVIFKYIYSAISNRLASSIAADTQKKMFAKLTLLGYSFFERNQQGRLIHATTIAPAQVADIVLYSIRFVYDSVCSLLLFWLLLALTWKGTLLLVAVGLTYAFFVRRVMRRVIFKCASTATEEDRKKNIILNEVITGIKAIKVFQNFPFWADKYNLAVKKSVFNRYRMLMGRVFPESFMKFILFAIIAVGGMVLSVKPPESLVSILPIFATFAMVAGRFFPSIQLIGNDLMIIADCIPNAQVVYNFCAQEPISTSVGNRIFSRFDHKISFENVWFKYATMPDHVLKDFSAEFKKREITAIVGLSGAGKTTIINLLLRFYAPIRGSVKIDGVDIFEYTDSSYFSKISYVGQETFIFNDTIKENIRFGMPGCSDDMIMDAARKAFAHDFIIKTQHGYDSLVGDSGMKLSGGQRQRIAIARAILHQPQIIILDEATSSLDNISEKNIQMAIDKISENTTILVIAHRLSTIQNADKIIALKDGMVIEQGSHKELFENKKFYFDLCLRQNGIVEG